MNNNIFPCLWFDGNGKEAADFYCELFGGTISADTPVVLNIDLFGQKLMFLNGGPQFEKNASVSFTILCETEEELQKYWTQISENGNVLTELSEDLRSKKYGWVRDQFGVTWQLNFSGNQDDQKIIPTLMFVHQNNGKAKQAREFYTSIFPNSSIGGVLNHNTGGGNQKAEVGGNLHRADFKIDHYSMICMENSHEYQFNFNEGISMVVMTDDQKETDHLWNSLIQNGGKPSMCGWLIDQFGLSWQIVPKRLLELMNDFEQPDKAQNVIIAMLSMEKIIISDLEEAYNSPL